MVRASFKAGQVIENALKRAQMLALSRFGLSVKNVLHMLDESIVAVAQAHFQTDKEMFYASKPVQGTTNGKYGATGSYDSVTRTLTVTMTPTLSANDIGKVVTFFDSSTTPKRAFAAVIEDIADGSTGYIINPYYPIPNIASALYISVLDWLLVGDVLNLTDNNQIFSPENLSLYDLSSGYTINLVSYQEFDRRKGQLMYSDGKSRWARYTGATIDFAAGSSADPLGTLMVGAYWIPPKLTSLGQSVPISDKRVPEVEDELVRRLLSIRASQPLQTIASLQGELAQAGLRDENTRGDEGKVR